MLAKSNQYRRGRSEERSPLLTPNSSPSDGAFNPTPRLHDPIPHSPHVAVPGDDGGGYQLTHASRCGQYLSPLRSATTKRWLCVSTFVLVIILTQFIATIHLTNGQRTALRDESNRLEKERLAFESSTLEMQREREALESSTLKMEQERLALESSTLKMEGEREALESSTLKMEEERGALESAIRRSEQERLKFKWEKQLLEDERELLEQERLRLEREKQLLEDERQLLEQERLRFEQERQLLEDERQLLEQERLRFEREKQLMEDERQLLEQERLRFEQERQLLEDERRLLEQEKQLLEDERQRLEQEKEALREERERWEKAREVRVPRGAFWDGIWPVPDCRAYGKREYWGILQNIPEGWTDVDACMNMPVEIEGVFVRRPYRCAYVEDSPHINGYWMVDWDQPDCKPWYEDFHDTVRGITMVDIPS